MCSCSVTHSLNVIMTLRTILSSILTMHGEISPLDWTGRAADIGYYRFEYNHWLHPRDQFLCHEILDTRVVLCLICVLLVFLSLYRFILSLTLSPLMSSRILFCPLSSLPTSSPYLTSSHSGVFISRYLFFLSISGQFLRYPSLLWGQVHRASVRSTHLESIVQVSLVLETGYHTTYNDSVNSYTTTAYCLQKILQKKVILVFVYWK